MSLRADFFDALNGKRNGYLPFDFELCPSLGEEFKERTGCEDYHDYYGLPIRKYSVEYIGGTEKFNKYFDSLENISINSWGIGFKKGMAYHFNQKIHPMKSFSTLSEFESYPYPDPERDFLWDNTADVAKSIKSRDLIAYANMSQTIFETAWQMRGMERLMIDMAEEPELAHYHFDRVTEVRCEFARRYASAGFDIIAVGDDVSSQLGMMISVDMWREFLKPRLAEIISCAKKINPEIYIFYHGCGNLQAIIPELIDIGVNILNPIQPECMDPFEVKKRYGDKLVLWGALGTQRVMPFGTSDEVRKACMQLIEKMGRTGRFVLSPSHVLEPEVLWDNIQAFIETVRKYNKR